MENFLCGLFVYQLLLLAFVMKYIKLSHIAESTQHVSFETSTLKCAHG